MTNQDRLKQGLPLLKVGDKVSYKSINHETGNPYLLNDIITGFDPNDTQVIILFDKEQKEYICQIDDTQIVEKLHK